jgi:hypothetical protein
VRNCFGNGGLNGLTH